nr:MAG TPA: transmembrane protein [Caudoviricetes sp.]
MDRAVNIITYAGVILLTVGALTAIWGGLVGLKIVGSGAVLIFTAMALSYCNEEIRLEKEEWGN